MRHRIDIKSGFGPEYLDETAAQGWSLAAIGDREDAYVIVWRRREWPWLPWLLLAFAVSVAVAALGYALAHGGGR